MAPSQLFCKAKVVIPQFIQRTFEDDDNNRFNLKNKIVTLIIQLDMDEYDFRKKSIEKYGYVDMSTTYFKGVIDDVSMYKMLNHNLLSIHYDYVCLVDIELA